MKHFGYIYIIDANLGVGWFNWMRGFGKEIVNNSILHGILFEGRHINYMDFINTSILPTNKTK